MEEIKFAHRLTCPEAFSVNIATSTGCGWRVCFGKTKTEKHNFSYSDIYCSLASNTSLKFWIYEWFTSLFSFKHIYNKGKKTLAGYCKMQINILEGIQGFFLARGEKMPI